MGKLDLGIFIASVIPGGPADRAGHIKPGHCPQFLIRIEMLSWFIMNHSDLIFSLLMFFVLILF